MLSKYAVLGEIDDRYPIESGIAGDGGAVPAVNLRAFSESVRSGYWYRRVTDGPEILGVTRDLLNGNVRIFEMRWPRFVRPGEGCGFHCDGPYMNRGTDRIFSAWIPLARWYFANGRRADGARTQSPAQSGCCRGISSPTPIEMACNGSTTTQCQYMTTMATGG